MTCETGHQNLRMLLQALIFPTTCCQARDNLQAMLDINLSVLRRLKAQLSARMKVHSDIVNMIRLWTEAESLVAEVLLPVRDKAILRVRLLLKSRRAWKVWDRCTSSNWRWFRVQWKFQDHYACFLGLLLYVSAGWGNGRRLLYHFMNEI